MKIEKNGKIYTAKENKASWTVSTKQIARRSTH